jgi:hypothetical protein
VPYVHRFGAAIALGSLTVLTLLGGWAHQVTPLRQDLIPPPLIRTSVDDALARLPSNALVFSSAPDAVYLLVNRPALALPTRTAEAML